MKILPVGTELFHADGQTDMSNVVAFRNFTKVPKIEYELHLKNLVPLSKRSRTYKNHSVNAA
jgi:hypothetical protein